MLWVRHGVDSEFVCAYVKLKMVEDEPTAIFKSTRGDDLERSVKRFAFVDTLSIRELCVTLYSFIYGFSSVHSHWSHLCVYFCTHSLQAIGGTVFVLNDSGWFWCSCAVADFSRLPRDSRTYKSIICNFTQCVFVKS